MSEGTIIPANPGFWLHWVANYEDEPEFTVYSYPIIGWRVTEKLATPITIDSIPERFDIAIQYPDGTVVDDGGTRHKTFDWWRESAEADFERMRAEDAAALRWREASP